MPGRRPIVDAFRAKRVAALGAATLALMAAPAAARPRIAWHGCGRDAPPNVQCGKLAVPLDYDHPRGPRIRLGFNRLRAADRAHRVGSLIVNPGGPGGAGSEIVAAEAAGIGVLQPRLHERFDLIGMDPRGVGLSTPVRCDPAVFNRPVSLFPSTAAEFRRLSDYARDLGRSCLQRTGPLLAHVDTLSVVRDMEALRRALRDGRLNFLGLSYGAEIGTEYAELYPRRIRAMALDGILDHSIHTQTVFADDTAAYEDTFNRFAAWCEATPACALHGVDVATFFDNLVARANAQPIPVPACATEPCRSPVTGDDIRLGLYDLLLFKQPIPAIGRPGWPGAAQALAAAQAGDAGAFAHGRATSFDDAVFPGLATNCIDYPRFVGGYDDFVSLGLLAGALAPHTRGAGEAWTGVMGCLRWPVPVANPPHRAHISGAPPILLVSATHDPSTPYRWAQDVLMQIHRAVLLTREGDGHTSSLLRPSRTNDAIADYLITRRPPPPNTVLPD
jgi:pimeloyl-ACP methyl ester carboxylesterase